jgi:hypothetical protein
VSLPSHRLLLGRSARPLRKMAGEDVKVRMDAASNVGVDMMSILTLVVEMCATRTGLLLLLPWAAAAAAALLLPAACCSQHCKLIRVYKCNIQ